MRLCSETIAQSRANSRPPTRLAIPRSGINRVGAETVPFSFEIKYKEHLQDQVFE